MPSGHDSSGSGRDRRGFLRDVSLAVVGLTAAGIAGRPGFARAADLPILDEKDPVAQSLGYHCDGAKAADHRAGEFCKGCQLFTGAADAKHGPCALFAGKQVCSGGWCRSWVKRAG